MASPVFRGKTPSNHPAPGGAFPSPLPRGGGCALQPAHLLGRRPPGARAAPAAPCSAPLRSARFGGSPLFKAGSGGGGDGRGAPPGACVTASPRGRCSRRPLPAPRPLPPSSSPPQRRRPQPPDPRGPPPPPSRPPRLARAGEVSAGWESRAHLPFLCNYRISLPPVPTEYPQYHFILPSPAISSEKERSGVSLPLPPAQRLRWHLRVFPTVTGSRCSNPSLWNSFHKKSPLCFHVHFPLKPLQVLQQAFFFLIIFFPCKVSVPSAHVIAHPRHTQQTQN